MYKYRRQTALFMILLLLFTVVETFFTVPHVKAEVSNESDESPIYLDSNESIEDRVNDLLARMSTDEKLGQMIQAERGSVTPEQVKEYKLGSVLSGGGSFPNDEEKDSLPENWSQLVDDYQDAALETDLGIPIIYGVDAVHGHNNVIGATIFPHNIGLGAANNEDLTQEVGAAVADEVRSTGVHWNFAPTIATAQNISWGRTYEAFSDDVARSASLGEAYVKGLQGDLSETDVVATAKHFIGEGYTDGGRNQGDISTLSEDEILEKTLVMYEKAIDAGVRTVMASYHSIGGLRMHANKRLLTDVLKGELGFDGFVITDYNGIDQISVDQDGNNVSGLKDQLKTAVNAGVDMFMQPQNWLETLNHLKNLVEDEEVSMDRVDDAVTRILRVKFEAGLFENPKTDPSLADEFGHEDHKDVARQAVRESLVLLKNDEVNGAPIMSQLAEMDDIFVAGRSADDIGLQSGGWTISWQGAPGNHTPGTTILEGIQERVGADKVTYNEHGRGAAGKDVAIAVLGEMPYAESDGDTSEITFDFAQNETLKNIRRADPDIPIIVVLVSGRPMIITDQMDDWAGLVAAWLPGTEGGGVADVLFGDYDFEGTLPIRWPHFMEAYPSFYGEESDYFLFETGYNLTKEEVTPELPEVPEKPEVESQPIPGKIEAEDWLRQSGLDTEETEDEGGGLNVGWSDSGDWLDYQINVTESGFYNVDIRYAADGNTGVQLIDENNNVIGEMSVSSTGGYQSWETYTIEDVALEEGNQRIRVLFTAGELNLNWYEFERTGDIPDDYDPTPEPPALPEDDEATVVKEDAVDNWLTLARDAQDMGWYYNSRWQEGDPKLEKQDNLDITQEVEDSEINTIHIDPSETYQDVMGIGASVDESTIYNMMKMSEEARNELIEKLVDPEDGIGMSLMRLTIGTSDFTAQEFYSYNDMPPGEEDLDLSEFSIEKDREFKIIDTVKKMQEVNPDIKFFASPWSPPGWMKTSDSMIAGQLKEGYEEVLAEYYLKFFQAYREEGIEIEAMTLQNEPLLEIDYPSMHLPWNRAVTLAKYLREKLDANGFDHVKLWMFDHNPADAQSYAARFLQDDDGYAAIDGTAFHDYGGSLSEMTKIKEQFPDKDVYLTERSVWGTHGADRIAQYFRNYARSYNSWVVMLDSDINTHQWVGTPDPTTIVQDSAEPDHYWLTPEYYIHGHYTKFVKPDYTRIDSDYGSSDKVTNVSFMSPDEEEIVTVVTNQTNADQKFKLVSEGTQFTAVLPANSVATYRWDRLEAHQVPGTINAVDYEEAEGTFSTSNGYVGELQDTATFDYLVDVKEAGDYYLDLGHAEESNEPQFEVSIDGESLGTLTSEATGWWENWAKIRTKVPLNKGIQRLRITAVGEGFNLNDITFTKAPNEHSVPGRIQAEQFTEHEGALIQDIDGGQIVSYLDPNDTMNYNIDVEATGTYKVTYRYASGESNPSLEWIVDGEPIHTSKLEGTEDWETWTEATDEIELEAGQYELQLRVVEGLNIDWISIGSTLDLSNATVTEGAEDGHIIDVSLENDTFIETLDVTDWELVGGPVGVTISEVNRVNESQAEVVLSGNRLVDYDTDIQAKLTVSNTQIQGWNNADSDFSITGEVIFEAIDDPESISVQPETTESGDGELTVTIDGGTFIEDEVDQIYLTGALIDSGTVSADEVIFNKPTEVTIKYSQDSTLIYEDVVLTVNIPKEAYADSTNGTTLTDNFILLGTVNQEEPTELPGEIDLEDFYKLSGVTVDQSIITDIEAGDWIEYMIDVPETKEYLLTLGFNTNSDASVVMKSDEGDELATVNVPNVWGQWSEVNKPISLESGKQIIRVYAEAGELQLNKLAIEELQVTESTEDIVRIEAEDYIDASQAIIQKGERTNIGYTVAGGWIDYLVNVPAGKYQVTYHYATTESGVSTRATVKENQITTALPATGDWENYQNAVSDGTIAIPEGDQTLRLDILVNGYNLDWLELQFVEPLPEEEPVEKSDLEELVEEAEALDADLYTEESWEILLEAMDDAKAVLEDETATQEEVDQAVTALQEAIEQLERVEPEEVDKSELETLVALQADKSEADYTAESWEVFAEALSNAEAVLADETATQEEVEAAVANLEVAIEQLEEQDEEPTPVEKSDLEELVEEAEALDADLYTEESWEILLEVMDDAKAVLEDEAATQEEVDQAVTALQEAIEQLERVEPEEVDKSELETLVSLQSDRLEADYTAESWEVFAEALSNAEAVLADETATQEEVNDAAADLEAAIEQLEEQDEEPTPVEKSDLEELVEEAEALDADLYTEKSWGILLEAMDDAKAILEDDTVTQEEVDQAVTALQEAIEQLERVESEEVDKSELEALVALQADKSEADYTAESWEVFAEALSNAEAVLADETATQEEVDDAVANLEAAIEQLEEQDEEPTPAEKSDLEELVAEAEALDADAYTAESYADLEAALAIARAVLADEEATQADIDTALEALKLAMNSLEAVQSDELDSEKPKDPVPSDPEGPSDDGGSLPATATSIYNWLGIGFMLLLIGGLIVFWINRKKQSVK
ncbi:glycoside hydrolase family 3 N-terminal domain-containing protein [Amphibacillus sp. Q70]|uniref:glycoside hydrolase family 3 N-terminal domain-containing protein n=1 Tax=Amphibacillus sp. Q70 TaxID=3453416 RepID=UPI003F863ED5